MNPVGSMMRTSQNPRLRGAAMGGLAFALAISFTGPAHAQGNVSGTYTLDVTEVSNSCEKAPSLASSAKLTVSQNKSDLVFQLPDMPSMSGQQRARGKFRVEGRDQSPRANGASGKFSATGRFDSGAVRMVLVAEYVKDGKIQCAQSWNITGKR